MRDLILTAFILGCLPVALMRPIVGLYLYTWISYMNPHRLTWSFAFDMPFAAWAAVVTVLGIIFTRKIEMPRFNAALTLWVCWVLWMNVTYLFALEPDLAHPQWIKVLKIQFMTFCTLLLVTTPERIKWFCWILFGSIIFYGIKGGIFTVLGGGVNRVWGPPGGFFEGNNELALTLLVTLPLLPYLYKETQNQWVRLGLIGAIPLTLLSVLASYSRGAFLALAGVGLHLIWKSKNKFILLPLVALFGIVALGFMPDKYWDRIESIRTYQEDGSAMGRINAWIFAYNLAKDRPIVGGGFQSFSPEQFQKWASEPEDHHDAHSIYFQVLGEHGFVGLAIFLSMIGFAYLTANRIRRRCKGHESLTWAVTLSSGLQSSLVAFGVGGAFLGMAYFDLFYHLIALMGLTWFCVNKELRGLQATDQPQSNVIPRLVT